MSLSTSELTAFRARCLQASLKGYKIANANLYHAQLVEMVGGDHDCPGMSAADLLELTEMALKGGKTKAKAKKPVAKLTLVKAPVEEPKAEEKVEEPAAEAPAEAAPAEEAKEEAAPAAEEAPAMGASAEEPAAAEEDDFAKPYEEWTKDDLYTEASARDVQGRSKMSKDELVQALYDDDESHA